MAIDNKLLSGVTVLLAVVEAGTIARAAEALGLSPSGVSRALSRLEPCGIPSAIWLQMDLTSPCASASRRWDRSSRAS